MGSHKPSEKHSGNSWHGSGNGYNSSDKRMLQALVEDRYFNDGMRTTVIANELDVPFFRVSQALTAIKSRRRAKEIKLVVPPISKPKAKVKNGFVEVFDAPGTPPLESVGTYLESEEGKAAYKRVGKLYSEISPRVFPKGYESKSVLSIPDMRG